MHWGTFRKNIIILCLLLFIGNIFSWRIAFDSIIGFGDSNTDSGNVYKLTNHNWPLVPPYFHGRFTNGRVWIEMLGVSDLKNYAYGGATSDNDLVQGYTALGTVKVPGVRQQIKMYRNETKHYRHHLSRTLFTIWAGGNVYFFNETLLTSQVINSILNSVHDLLDIGAKHILVFNRLPAQVMPYVQSHSQANYYTELVTEHNNILSLGLNNLLHKWNDVSVKLFDINSLILQILTNESLNLSNKKDSCWYIMNGTIDLRCTNAESYVFIDQYHFTTRIHQLIADAVIKFLNNSSRLIFRQYYIILCCLITFSFH